MDFYNALMSLSSTAHRYMGPRGFVNILDLILCDMSYQHCLLVCLAFMELRPWSDGADETLRHYMQTEKAFGGSAESRLRPRFVPGLPRHEVGPFPKPGVCGETAAIPWKLPPASPPHGDSLSMELSAGLTTRQRIGCAAFKSGC